MRVFVTGASGFIGSSVVPELVRAGHQVTGLARSDASAAALVAQGAAVQRGTLEDLDSLRAGAAAADGVIHLAFIRDFSQFEASARTDQIAIEALCKALEGRNAPLVIASGVLGLAPGQVVTERDDRAEGGFGSPRQAGVATALSYASKGVRPSVMRLPPSVHGTGDHGFMAAIVDVARKSGFSGYIGDGAARWPAVHVKDAARAFRLAVEKAPSGANLHPIGDEGVPLRAVAEVIGKHLGVPVKSVAPADAGAHFGFLGMFLGLDSPASSTLTRELLGWQPTEPGLLADLDAGHYFGAKP